MNSTKRAFFVETRDINYIRTTMEAYDGMALVRTLDPGSGKALLEVMIAPGCEDQVMALVQGLNNEEGIPMTPADHSKETGSHPFKRPFGRKSYVVLTMGCQMNEYDSEYMERCLSVSGFQPAATPQDADLVIINTCSVREKAEQKAMSTLGRITSLKKRKPEMIIALAGCVAQQEGKSLIERFPSLDLVVGTRHIHRIASLVDQVSSTGEPVVETGLDAKEMLFTPPAVHKTRGSRVKGFITIMQGCNNFCTYCIVPYVRGREVSRSPEHILREAEDLIAGGVREITLLGQNVNSYSWSKDGVLVDFPALLRRMDSLPGLKRLRFTTSHPKDLTDDLIRCFEELERLCGHIHLPFQAGSNSVLRRMNRGYTREQYLDLVARLRRVRSYIGITADVMVGFPGETTRGFDCTMSLIEQVGFDNLYSFKYSDRQGTAALELDGKVDDAEKTLRLNRLQALQKQITLEKNRALKGYVVEVLVEGLSKKGHQLTGRSECNRVVNFDFTSNIIGDIVQVIVKDGRANSLLGELAVSSEMQPAQNLRL